VAVVTGIGLCRRPETRCQNDKYSDDEPHQSLTHAGGR
jgi:hypothetical protein